MAPGLVTADDIMEFDLDADALDPRARSTSNASSAAHGPH
jgi:hypothetical protein